MSEFKEKQEDGIPLTNNKLAEIMNQIFKELLTDKKNKEIAEGIF